VRSRANAGMRAAVMHAFEQPLSMDGAVRAGAWVAVHGCGGVGPAAVMIAAAAGAQVIAVDVDARQLERARPTWSPRRSGWRRSRTSWSRWGGSRRMDGRHAMTTSPHREEYGEPYPRGDGFHPVGSLPYGVRYPLPCAS
jgi:hypothetical protein